LVAEELSAARPHLKTAPVPFALSGTALELLWPSSTEDDAECRFLREKVLAIARTVPGSN
jgi:LysR family transcriptional regulator, mexEF-oprN operon transcriptional activator